MQVLLVAVGGAIGAVARYGVGVGAAKLFGLAFPWGTLMVNVLGCLAMGVLAARLDPADESLRLAVGVGVLGGFTTFSAFSWQTFEQLQKGNWGTAAANVLISIVVCIAATWLGWRWAR